MIDFIKLLDNIAKMKNDLKIKIEFNVILLKILIHGRRNKNYRFDRIYFEKIRSENYVIIMNL